MNSNDNFQQSESLTSDAVLPAFLDDVCILVGNESDNSQLLANLLATAAVSLNTDRRVARKCIRRAATLLGMNVSQGGGTGTQRSLFRGGLALWQAKQVKCYIEGKLDSTIRASDLAALVRLSTSHFFRAFRKTFGDTPADYIMKRRMLRAQELMSKSRVPLSQVALECGMCDQAHFSRTFRRIVGISPTVWRRQLLQGPAFVEEKSPGRRPSAAASSYGMNAPIFIAPVVQKVVERGNEHVCEID